MDIAKPTPGASVRIPGHNFQRKLRRAPWLIIPAGSKSTMAPDFRRAEGVEAKATRGTHKSRNPETRPPKCRSLT